MTGKIENVTVNEASIPVDTQSGDTSHVVSQTAIGQLPLNGRRFTDLALPENGLGQQSGPSGISMVLPEFLWHHHK